MHNRNRKLAGPVCRGATPATVLGGKGQVGTRLELDLAGGSRRARCGPIAETDEEGQATLKDRHAVQQEEEARRDRLCGDCAHIIEEPLDFGSNRISVVCKPELEGELVHLATPRIVSAT